MEQFQCQENYASENIPSEGIINHIFYFLIYDSSDQDGALTVVRTKMEIKELSYAEFLIIWLIKIRKSTDVWYEQYWCETELFILSCIEDY